MYTTGAVRPDYSAGGEQYEEESCAQPLMALTSA